MIRVFIVVEGETEEGFVKEVLGPHLQQRSVFLFPLLLGGVSTFAKVAFLVNTKLKQDQAAYLTTMLDLYALPKGFPGKKTSLSLKTGAERAAHIAFSWLEQLAASKDKTLAALVQRDHFIPYVQAHEYEALLFAKPKCIADALVEYHDGLAELQTIKAKFPTPEDINDSPQTGPSKRLLSIYGNVYQKTLYGPYIAGDIGLETLREECPHFNSWVTVLEQLGDE